VCVCFFFVVVFCLLLFFGCCCNCCCCLFVVVVFSNAQCFAFVIHSPGLHVMCGVHVLYLLDVTAMLAQSSFEIKFLLLVSVN
jgi:hypothetical protein